MSFSRPAFVTCMRTPILSSASCSIGRMEMTPMEPTSAIGTATIFDAPQATM